MAWFSRIFNKGRSEPQVIDANALANTFFHSIWNMNTENLRRAIETEGTFANIRLHARQLARSSPLLGRYISILDEHVIPAEVERPSFKKKLDSVIVDEIGEAWHDWYSGPVGVNRETGTACEQLALYEEIVAGEVFFMYNNGVVQHLPSEAISKPVILKNGKITKWVSAKSKKQYSANALIQVARFTELTQCRGITWLARALPHAQTLADYSDGAGLNMSVLAKVIGQLVTDRDGSLSMMDAIGNSTGVISDNGDKNDGVKTMNFQAGTMLHPEAGTILQGIDFGPNKKAQDYAMTLMANVATALGISLAALLKDYSRFNFASLQVGENDDRKMFNKVRAFWHNAYRARIFKRWLLDQSASGDFDSKAVIKVIDDLMKPQWRGPVQSTAQPLKDAQALNLMASLGQINLVDLANVSGGDARANALIYKELLGKM